jgi:Uma2 family endonuclease
MSPELAEKRYTVEEFEALSDFDHHELIDGVPVEKMMGTASDSVTMKLLFRLGPFVEAHDLGDVGGSETGFVLFPDESKRVRKPDASFVRKGRYAGDKLTKGYGRLVPDLAFESVSPGDFADDVQLKVEEYLRAKVALVWVAYPESKTVLAYRPDGTVQRFAGDAVLVAEDVFPGFACPLPQLFARV